MGALADWLAANPDTPDCAPDPDDALFGAEGFEDGDYPVDDIEAHGYDARFTPVDTLIAAPFAMHSAYGNTLQYGDYA